MNHFETFYQLHHAEKPLLLANAWNVKSAQLIEQHGFTAIATSSGAISSSLGYPDGEKIPFSELLYIIKRIKACTNIPLTIDLERGYADDTLSLTKHVQQLLDTGVAGINLEDAQGEDLFLEKLYGIKNYLSKTNQQLFINARTDGFLLKLDAPLEITMQRAKRYEAAGADGLFVTAVSDPEIIRTICSGTTLPVNVVGNSKISSVEALSQLGVRRISMAVLLYKASVSYLDTLIKSIGEQQSLVPLF